MWLVYHARMGSPPAERKALLFSAGGVRFALRVGQVREILAVDPGAGEVRVRGEMVAALPLGVPLGLPGPLGGFAVVTEAQPPLALRVDALHGIVDLAAAEFFLLPARTALPQPPPFLGALVVNGEIALELSAPALGWAPLEAATAARLPPPDAPAPSEPEILFARGTRTFGVPVSLLVQVLEGARVTHVPLAPADHRGLLYHGRAIHPVFDVGAIYGDAAAGEPRSVLLLDAGGSAVGLVADRVLRVAEGERGQNLVRPSWDSLFAA